MVHRFVPQRLIMDFGKPNIPYKWDNHRMAIEDMYNISPSQSKKLADLFKENDQTDARALRKVYKLLQLMTHEQVYGCYYCKHIKYEQDEETKIHYILKFKKIFNTYLHHKRVKFQTT